MTKYGTPSGRHEWCARGCGTCAEVDDRGLMPEHTSSTYRIDMCVGSLKPSQQEDERRRCDRVRARDARAAALRDDAAVALDAVLTGHANSPELMSRLDEMRKLALHALGRSWTLRDGSSPTVAWLWEHRSHARGDVYCAFCGEMLARDVAKPLWHRKFELHIGHGPARCGDHLTSCALMVLAGMREPVSPGTKKLPVEFRQDD